MTFIFNLSSIYTNLLLKRFLAFEIALIIGMVAFVFQKKK